MSAAVIPYALAGLGAASSMSASQSQESQLEAQAVAQEKAAEETMLQGYSQSAQVRSQADDIIGSTVSAAVGSGVQADTGSVLDVIKESAFNIELDALTIESDAKRQAQNQKQTAANIRASKPTGVQKLLGAFGSGASGYASGMAING